MRKESFGKIILFTTTGMPNQVVYEQRGCGKVSSDQQIATSEWHCPWPGHFDWKSEPSVVKIQQKLLVPSWTNASAEVQTEARLSTLEKLEQGCHLQSEEEMFVILDVCSFFKFCILIQWISLLIPTSVWLPIVFRKCRKIICFREIDAWISSWKRQGSVRLGI